MWPQAFNLKKLDRNPLGKANAKLGSFKPNGFWQEDFQIFHFIFSVLLPWQPEFLKESIFFKNSEEDHGRNISVKFHQNQISWLYWGLTPL